MLLTEAIIFLTIFTIAVAIGSLVIYLFNITYLKKFELLIAYMGAVSALLLSYNIYIVIRSEDMATKHRLAQSTLDAINRNYIMPQKELVDYFPEGYFLYASMVPDSDLKKQKPLVYNPVKRKQIELYASFRFFQAIEDFLSIGAFDLTGAYLWINNFLMWMQSPILQHHWKIFAFNFAPDTRDLMRHLIDKANFLIELRKIKGKLTTEDYESLSKKIPVPFR